MAEFIFPAYAGVIPDRGRFSGSVLDFPRVCGGDPKQPVVFTITDEFSPRMRG